jgi:hypothetical protein
MRIIRKCGRAVFNVSCVVGVLGPTAIALFFVGVLAGEPKPCEGKAPCIGMPYTIAELSILPILTASPAVCTYALLMWRKIDENQKKKQG